MASPRAIAVAAARAFGLPPAIFLSQIGQESGFNPRARSSAGALGIAQFMPATARSMGVNPYNVRSALYGAARMDARNLHKYGNWRDVLSLYNSGRGWEEGQKIGQTRAYVAGILAHAGSGAVGTGATIPAPPLSSQMPAAANPAARKALALSLIQASQATSRGEVPDYTGVFAALAARRQATQAPGLASLAARGAGASPVRGGGVAHFDGRPVAAWIAPILQRARAAGWKGTVESGYRSRAEQARIYASGVRPAARPGTSNHEFTAFPGGAVDVSNAAELNAILRRLGITALQWAGGKDPVHFSHPHAGGY